MNSNGQKRTLYGMRYMQIECRLNSPILCSNLFIHLDQKVGQVRISGAHTDNNSYRPCPIKAAVQYL